MTGSERRLPPERRAGAAAAHESGPRWPGKPSWHGPFTAAGLYILEWSVGWVRGGFAQPRESSRWGCCSLLNGDTQVSVATLAGMKPELAEPAPHSAEDALLERMWTLHAQLKDEHPRTAVHKRLMTEIQTSFCDASRPSTQLKFAERHTPGNAQAIAQIRELTREHADLMAAQDANPKTDRRR
jgi:hypothetical protein